MCRYCLILESRKRSALPFSRFEQLVHQYHDWRQSNGRDDLEIGIFVGPSFDYDLETLKGVAYVNVIVADKQPHLQYLDMDAAVKHCTRGAGIWPWASSDYDSEPDLVMASCGDIATMEALAATELQAEIDDLRRETEKMRSRRP
jgi:hypothetical protein